MATKDYYAILGVSRQASADEIRRAYRRLARQYHPDLHPGNRAAEERFKQISEAYDALSDPRRRKLYDEFGEEGLQPGFDPERAREFRRWAESGRGFFFGRGGFGFESFGGGRWRGARGTERGFADILREMFGGAGEQPTPARGRDVELAIDIPMLEALRGTKRTVIVRRPVVCLHCGGSGAGQYGPCPRCTGKGTVEEQERLAVKIPAGISDGARVRVAGKGGAGEAGGPPGDLYILVHVKPHRGIERRGNDLTIDVPVTVGEALLGATITVPTPDGHIQLKIPPGSQSGRLLRVRGRGARDPKRGERGDLYVRLMVQLPSHGLEQDVREAVAVLERAYGGDPRRDLRF